MLRTPVGGMCFTFNDISAQITTRNERALRAKQAAMAWGSLKPHFPNAAIVTPNASGPRTRATLNWIELSATAFGRSFFSTSDGMSDWYAGPPNACATPVMNDSSRMCQIWTTCRYIRIASDADVDIWMYCDVSSVRRRS